LYGKRKTVFFPFNAPFADDGISRDARVQQTGAAVFRDLNRVCGGGGGWGEREKGRSRRKEIRERKKRPRMRLREWLDPR
jgi:hypothetical protein